jgi:hypothetical protein
VWSLLVSGNGLFLPSAEVRLATSGSVEWYRLVDRFVFLLKLSDGLSTNVYFVITYCVAVLGGRAYCLIRDHIVDRHGSEEHRWTVGSRWTSSAELRETTFAVRQYLGEPPDGEIPISYQNDSELVNQVVAYRRQGVALPPFYFEIRRTSDAIWLKA